MYARDAIITEWLDGESLDEPALRRNLRDIRRINALLGWRAFTTASVARVARREGMRSFSLVDVAAGSADMVASIARWAVRAGVNVNLLATDVNPRIVAIAREQVAGLTAVRVERQDALALSYAPGTFDIALCTLALHHFDPPPATALLREMARVARHVLVFDVARSRLAYLGAVLLTRVGMMDAMTRHDAPASVRRAYSRAELSALASGAELRGATVREVFPFRLALESAGAAQSE